MDKPFAPTGPTIVVGSTATQFRTDGPAGGIGNSFRVRNLSSSAQYFTTGGAGVTSLTPAAGTPALNTIGMLPNSVETFANLAGQYMIASSATGFEVTQGDGV